MSASKLRRSLTTAARIIYKTLLFKMLYPAIYRIRARRPVKRGKVVFIEVRLPALSNNFELLHKALCERDGYDVRLCCLRLGYCGALAYIKRCIAMIREIADAEVLFINEGSTVLASLPIRRGTTFIQTWHGCGAFKKFGMCSVGDIVTGSRRERELFPMCRHLDFITISSDEVAWAYRESFDLHEGDGQQVVATGVSRTDIFFMPERINAANEAIRRRFPVIGDRKIILYAPTFRGHTTDAHIPDALDISLLNERLGNRYVLLIKHHPVAKDKQVIPPGCEDFAFDVCDTDINELLMTADVCVSDYSSLIHEYSLLDRPMIFFTYDYEDFTDWRGFYYPFEEFCPGAIVRTTAEIADCIEHPDGFDMEKVRAFRKKFMTNCDGHATERILALMDETVAKKRSAMMTDELTARPS